jgi:FtsP/CotA-like multicopper oxidase with cupredoxin domain
MPIDHLGHLVWSLICRLRHKSFAATLSSLAALLVGAVPAAAQAIPTTPCPLQVDLTHSLPEIVSANGRLRGLVVLSDAQKSFQVSAKNGNATCVPQLLRFFQNHEPGPPDPNKVTAPLPGPTLRAKLGDIVELTFLNQIDPLDYGNSLDLGKCDSSSGGYPGSAGDTMPNCFHGSATGNIHFHGTHTSPTSTGDDVFIMVRPSPRKDGNPTVTAETFQKDFDIFFTECEKKLKDPLEQWPKIWTDLPEDYRVQQEELLKNSQEPLWQENEEKIHHGEWPQYYVGAFPYCFALPKYPDAGAPTLRMGQAPGTHWYHAHKHGSTAIDVSNGMAGAFIIEGDAYDGKLNAFYDQYRTNKSTEWTRQQPTLVVNQLGLTPSLERGSGGGRGAGPPSFSVNGEQQPPLTMYPGQVQLWRIVNLSPISGFYISGLPEGFTWRQIAQDGVQFDDQNYQKRAQRPVFVAPGNRIDLLVRAPEKSSNKIFPVNVVQGVSVSTAQTSTPGTVLFSVVLSGSGPAMPLMPHAPPRPSFLHDIKPAEVAGHTRTIVFETTAAASGKSQHTIDGVKFTEGKPLEIKPLNTAEEWTVENKTVGTLIDHPFHIHVNPFQVTEVFDPNAPLLDSHGFPVGKEMLYVVSTTKPQLQPGQCWLNPNDQATWKPCNTSLRTTYPSQTTNIWWDVFPIPSGISAPADAGTVIIPGYFKMRSRFVDYRGSYVIHCHILAHEDRGMMMEVDLDVNNAVPMEHH